MLESSWAVVDFGASSELPMGAEDFSVAIDELLLRVSVRVSFVRRVREEFCVCTRACGACGVRRKRRRARWMFRLRLSEKRTNLCWCFLEERCAGACESSSMTEEGILIVLYAARVLLWHSK